MKQLLVATDFSACAGNAMEYALGIAKVLELEVCVIHAIGENEGVDNNIFNAIYIEDYRNNKKQTLGIWADSFKNTERHADVQITTFVEVGSVTKVLTDYINDHPVEMLVMGTMGSTGITGLFGSNANAMIIKTKTPTLIVPLESKFIENPVITLAIDFSSNLSVKDVNALQELIEAFRLQKLNVVNVIEDTAWKVNEAGESRLKELITDTTLDFNYIKEDNTVGGIMNFIVSNNTDILCVVKHHHNLIYRIFNKSTINQVMNKTIKAILVLHE